MTWQPDSSLQRSRLSRCHTVITTNYSCRNLVRWLVLGDKWPTLAAALTSDPAKMTALEATDTIAGLRKAVTSLASAKVATRNCWSS